MPSQWFLSPPGGTVVHTTIKTSRSQSFCQYFTLIADFWGLLQVNETTSKLRFFWSVSPHRDHLRESRLTARTPWPAQSNSWTPTVLLPYPCVSISLRAAPCVPRCCLLLPESPDRMVCPHSSAGTHPAPVLAASAHLQFIFLGYN